MAKHITPKNAKESFVLDAFPPPQDTQKKRSNYSAKNIYYENGTDE